LNPVLAAVVIMAAPGHASSEFGQINIPDDPRVLPYKFVCKASRQVPGPVVGRYFFRDIDNDGFVEECGIYSRSLDSSHFMTAVVAIPHCESEGKLIQYNGPLMSCYAHITSSMDIIGDSGDDIIMVKHLGDTLFTEIISFGLIDGRLTLDTTLIFPAAISSGFSPGQSWHSIHVYPLLAYDVTGDGIRELLYSAWAKPDSAITRGIRIYDFARQHQTILFPAADGTNEGGLAVFKNKDSAVCFVATIMSNANGYTCNGMTSQEAYVVGFDLRGRERWRRTIGRAFYHPMLAVMDINNDGLNEAIVTVELTPVSDSTIVGLTALEPFTGNEIVSFGVPVNDYLPNDHMIIKSSSNPPQLLYQCKTESETLIWKLGQDFDILGRWKGNVSIQPCLVDLLDDTPPGILAVDPGGSWVLLSTDMRPLARWPRGGGFPEPGTTIYGHRLLISHNYGDSDLLSLERQGLFIRAVAYLDSLSLSLPVVLVILGSLLAWLIWRMGRIVWGWRQTALGLPTLDRIAAMVLLLDRKGRILFANNHPVAERLLGNKWKRRQMVLESRLGRFEELRNFLKSTLADPMGFHQQRFEIGAGDSIERLEVVVYPHVNANNVYYGKIVIAEDISDKQVWQWRMVLGEATQKWVHRLKHHLGAARMFLGNVQDDPVVAERIETDSEIRDQWLAADKQIVEAGNSVSSILKYLRNPKPEFSVCDINEIIRTVFESHRRSDPDVVAFLPMAELPVIPADPDQMQEVIDNLLSNALQAVKKKGRVTILSRLADDLLFRENGKVIEIVVQDTGAGMPETDLAMLRKGVAGFSRFAGGTGVGLALVREIVANHGGSLNITSEPGQGSCFVVGLPVKQGGPYND